ncbi:MAG: hypothetical protein IAE93_05925 [Ignavibacteria bacterium]|nr:hypothetical protein [Ignavibacteria bacterium]
MNPIIYYLFLIVALIIFIFLSIIPIYFDYKRKNKQNPISIFEYYSQGSNVIQTAGIFGSFIISFLAIFFSIDSNISSGEQMELANKMFSTTKLGIDTNIIANNKMIRFLDSISTSSNNLKNNMDIVSYKLSNLPGKIDSISYSLGRLNNTFFEQKQIAQKEYTTKIKPILVLTKEEKRDSCAIILWNSGSGIAYDIDIETHLAKNIGNVGPTWMLEVIQAATELRTKNFIQLWNANNSSYNRKTASNHPLILPSGIDYGYKSSPMHCWALNGVFIVIRYRDEIGNKFYSFWDGWQWKFGEGEIHPIPVYDTIKDDSEINLDDPVSQFMFSILEYIVNKPIHMFKSEKDFNNWVDKASRLHFDTYLFKEAEYLKKIGYGDIPAKVNAIYEMDLKWNFKK